VKMVDANVFIYAVGGPGPYRESCQRFLRSLYKQSNEFLTNVEVLQEILHVLGRRGRRTEAAALVLDVMRSLRSIIPIQAAEISAAIAILKEYPQISTRDAVHAAVVRLHGLEGVVSADRGFDVIRGVTRFDPLEMFPD
jgi:predicted nucleic acid-binding protein